MSYTQFASTARCKVNENFNLKEYVTSLSDFISNHIEDDRLNESVRLTFEDYDQEDVISKIEDYFRLTDDQLLFIECDSEESNGDSEVWDWLCYQVRQDVMISSFMEINSATIDSRSGVECGTSYLMKDGTFIGSDDIFSLLEKAIPGMSHGLN